MTRTSRCPSLSAISRTLRRFVTGSVSMGWVSALRKVPGRACRGGVNVTCYGTSILLLAHLGWEKTDRGRGEAALSPSWYERGSREVSWFERTLREKSSDEIFTLPPNVWVRGEMRHADGSELSEQELDALKWIISPVVSAAQEINLPPPFDRFKVRAHTVFPKTVIDLSGMQCPYTWMSGEPRLVIPLGIIMTLQFLPATFGLLARILASEQQDIEQLRHFQPPDEVIGEIDRLIKAWDASSGSTGIIPRNWDTSLAHRGRGSVYVVVGHELGQCLNHQGTGMARRMRDVKGHYKAGSEENVLVNSTVMKNVRQLLRDKNILHNWIRETLADCDAYEYAFATMTHGGWIKGSDALPYLREAYVDMSVFFSILGLYEIYAKSREAEPDVTTHPSALVRSAIFCHIQAKKLRMSQQTFLFQQFGAGVAVQFIMGRIFEECRRLGHFSI